ncbi:hypothetical protein [Caldisericum sp. AR60]|uniref:hypothetical protein n=1 Tax=Caldisericum sp. AR60 TaxID=3397852 RepID=UPI0039FC5308
MNDIALIGSDAFVSLNVFEKKGTPEEAFWTGKNPGEKLIKVNLHFFQKSVNIS